MAKRTKQLIQIEEGQEEIRLNKFLSEAGACSRREADTLIEQGKVKINGVVAAVGTKVKPSDEVKLHDKLVEKEQKLAFIVLNKPVGIVCTTDKREPDNIIDFVNYKSRIFPIGRLDKDSEGLILLTNDGNIVNKILRAENEHEKEYVVQVNKPITEGFLDKMSKGVPILDTVTKPCVIKQESKDTFRIILTQGLNRQIRRMCEYFGYRVISLKRVRIMNISLGRLKTGDYRNVTEKEMETMVSAIRENKVKRGENPSGERYENKEKNSDSNQKRDKAKKCDNNKKCDKDQKRDSNQKRDNNKECDNKKPNVKNGQGRESDGKKAFEKKSYATKSDKKKSKPYHSVRRKGN